MKPKEHCKEGKKYMLVGHIGIFGSALLWADNIKDFRVCDLTDVSEGKALLLKTMNNNVVRINRNGTKWYVR
jgi:hypothetical protein